MTETDGNQPSTQSSGVNRGSDSAEIPDSPRPDVAETEPRLNSKLQELVEQACCGHRDGNGHGYQGLTRYCDECGLNWPRGTNPRKHTTEALMVALREERAGEAK